MALGTGSIRFSQIVSEFGGVSPHRFSEYKSLSGLGVSGVPASGSMRFSQFRGKSNQVSTQVWVSSGYSSSSWVQRYNGYREYNWRNSNTFTGYQINNMSSYGRHNDKYVWYDGSVSWTPISVGGATTYYWGNFKHQRGSHQGSWTSNNGNTHIIYYALLIYENVTAWIDTSAYQTQTTTARIST